MFKYEVIIYWSEEDQAFIAEVPELPGCAADGATYQEALANVEVVIKEWIETAKELGRPIPALYRIIIPVSYPDKEGHSESPGGSPVACGADREDRPAGGSSREDPIHREGVEGPIAAGDPRQALPACRYPSEGLNSRRYLLYL